jgi:hypothetical protein
MGNEERSERCRWLRERPTLGCTAAPCMGMGSRTPHQARPPSPCAKPGERRESFVVYFKPSRPSPSSQVDPFVEGVAEGVPHEQQDHAVAHLRERDFRDSG